MHAKRIVGTMALAALLVSAAAATWAPSVFAGASVSINWTSCTGPINLNTSGGAPANAFVSILGQTQVSQAYQCVTLLGSSNAPIADAWRFDPSGCEGSSLFTLNHLAPSSVSKTCPSFQGILQSLQIKDYAYDVASGKVRITLANAYPNADASNNPQGNPAAVSPSQRYFLANYLFDLTFATTGPTVAGSTCGHLETPVCFVLLTASWLDLSGAEFQLPIANGGYLTTNDPNNGNFCPIGPDPAAPTTWGRVKSQYR